MKRPAFWIVLGVVSLAAAFIGARYFPQAFSIVALDITMDRDRALADARTIMTRDRRGPPDYRQAASFTQDEEAQTFVELEGGGKDVFTRMLRDGLSMPRTPGESASSRKARRTRRRSASRRTAVRTDSWSG